VPSPPNSEQIRRMEARLAQNPRSLIFAQLADAYRQGGRLEEAIRTCEEGLSQHQNYASAYMVLGRAYKEKGGVLPARDAFRRVLDLDPESVLAHHFLGQIAEAQGEIPEALSAYQAALTLHPFDKDVRASVERLRASTAAAALLSERPDVSPRASLSAREPVTAMPAPWEDREVAPASPPHDADLLATETLADLYAAQGVYDQASEIYARLMTGAPDRKDLAQKHQDTLARARETVASETSAPVSGDEALSLLEAWRDAFGALKRDREGSTGLLEAWREAFRKLKDHRGGRTSAGETASHVFREAETAREEPVAILVAWRDAFRRLKTARGATRSGA